ncbi:helix-turn-helix domain-containing protein [Streptomyces sp. NPDC096132]|uniref:helix-turn-helix domain-containing protein n=1 Tax=Streptomyces sp. NPDC096132 TaxID=3366075 RepID=UPI003812CA80
MDRAAQIVAANLRQQRARARLSLAELARLSGVAKATLSSLEAGVGNPTIQTLWLIANALGTSFSDLLAEPAAEAEVRVLKPAQDEWPDDGEETIELCSRWPARGVTETYMLSLGAGARYESERHAAGVVEHLIVLEGAVRCGPLDAPEDLERHHYIQFPADTRHLYEAKGGPARCLLIVSYASPPPAR